MQDYKERIANAWKASDKPPKEWISNHTLNIVREARIRLKARGKDDYTLYELSRECNMSSSIVTACMWSLTKGKTILPGTRPLQDTVHEVYDVICLYQKEYETSPTVREIRDELGLSISTIQASLVILASLGCIDYLVGRSRTIRMVMKPDDVHLFIDDINVTIKAHARTLKQANKRPRKDT